MTDTEAVTLTDEERERLGGPDGPWIKDDWDGLLDAVESILAARLAGAGAQVTEAACNKCGHPVNAPDGCSECPDPAESAWEAWIDPLSYSIPGNAGLIDCTHKAFLAGFAAALPHMGTGQSEADLRERLDAVRKLADETKHKTTDHLGNVTGYLIFADDLNAVLDRPAAAEGNESHG